MNNNISIKNIIDIDESALKLIHQMGDEKIYAFYGEMGVGKTTFIKSICKMLGVKENVNSPTFSIVNEYKTSDFKTIYHFDCYRINKIQEALEIGILEYFDSGNICFIEWPEKISEILPDSIISVHISELTDQSRNVEIIKKI
jgi:tRNA threonylcarbamoyladenosine biosynthesis protein TsaE